MCAGMRAHIAKVARFYQGVADNIRIAEQRNIYNAMAAHFARPRPAGMRVTDDLLDDGQRRVPVRLYRPAAVAPGPAPVMLYFHGGGFALGGLDSHDGTVAKLAEAGTCVGIAVDYSLAPEHPFPAACDDAWSVYLAVVTQPETLGVDPGQVIVAGDSAGAALAAGIAITARDRAAPSPVGQLLIYPVLGIDFDTASYLANANAPMLTRSAMMTFWNQYLSCRKDWTDPRAAPLAAASFVNLPPAFIATAEFDPVRDDGLNYANALEEAGVAATYRCAETLPHGYLRAIEDSPAAAVEVQAIGLALRSFAHR